MQGYLVEINMDRAFSLPRNVFIESDSRLCEWLLYQKVSAACPGFQMFNWFVLHTM